MSHKENRETGQSNDVLTQLLVHRLSLFQRNKTCIYSDKELGFEEHEGGDRLQQENSCVSHMDTTPSHIWKERDSNAIQVGEARNKKGALGQD